MLKVMNTVFGIGITVVLVLVILLGVKTFYPEPDWFEECEPDVPRAPIVCDSNMTVAACNDLKNEDRTIHDTEWKECHDRQGVARDAYGQNIFFITVIIGIIMLLISMFILSAVNISAGIALAGIILLFYGFMRGWDGTDDKLKFIVGIIVAILVITFAVITNKKVKKKK